MKYDLEFFKYSDNSILINWPQKIDEAILVDILNFKNAIEISKVELKIEVINTYCSILISYQFNIDDINSEISTYKDLYLRLKSTPNITKKLWEIPVCYNQKYGIDLKAISVVKNMSISDIIEYHSTPVYTVYFLGFLPGFPYLGGLSHKLFMDRKATPQLDVQKGSVAIGGRQTGIYPQNSPGGWHIIGRTPIDLFTPFKSPPCNINAGDKIRFVPITTDEFYRIRDLVDSSNYTLKPV